MTGYAQVVEEIVASQVTKQYTYGLDLISQNQNGVISFYNYDGHGSVRQLSDSTGTITDTYTYDAFGNIISQTGNTSNSYLYAGEQFDSDLGFYYNRARYLNVQTGRFISQDTYEGNQFEPETLHKYTYTGNNPINFNDASGNARVGVATSLVGVQLLIDLATVVVFLHIMEAQRKFVEENINRPKVLYHYTPYENLAGIIATGIRPSIRDPQNPRSDAQHGDGQYFTDITDKEASQYSMWQLSRALFLNPFHWGGKPRRIAYIAILTDNLRIRRAVPVFSKTYGNKYIYVRLGTKPLLLEGIIFDVGEVNFSN